jgi:hypothetical protein
VKGSRESDPFPITLAAAVRALTIALLGIAACAGRAAGPSAGPTPSKGSATSAPSFDWEGSYLDPANKKQLAQVVVGGGQAWLMGPFGALATSFEAQGDRVALPGASLVLARRSDGAGWRLDRAGAAPAGDDETPQLRGTLDQIADPFLGRILRRLNAGAVFHRLDKEGHPTFDVLTVSQGLHAKLELGEPKPRCSTGVLLADPTSNGSRVPSFTPAQPPANQVGERLFLFLDRRGDDDCTPLGPELTTSFSMGAGVRLFADADGTPVGAMLIGYMYAELFVADGRTRADVERLLPALDEEQSKQAE